MDDQNGSLLETLNVENDELIEMHSDDCDDFELNYLYENE